MVKLKNVTLLLCCFLLTACADKSPDINDFHEIENWFAHDLEFNRKIKKELNSRKIFSRILYEGQDNSLTKHVKNQKYIINSGIPYYRYWQLKDKKAYVFHPMAFGRYLFNNGDEIFSDSISLKNITKVAYRLPEQTGLAYYYPEHYPLNRMLGPDIVYSAIGQSEILAAYLNVDSAYGQREYFVKKSLSALIFDYYKGGTNLCNKALLEIPLFRSAPEIILNGWLHAMLHLNDYCRIYEDTLVENILRSNIDFFIQHNENWYDAGKNISLYSDMAPYKATISFDDSVLVKERTVHIWYVSLEEGIRNQVVELHPNDTVKFGAYDNHIFAISGNSAKIYFNCSALFDTYITADEPFSVSFYTGSYDPVLSTPNSGGNKIILESNYSIDNGYHLIDFNGLRSQLMQGYPTNFAKQNGKNYYHVHHIISLMYLGNFCYAIDEIKRLKLLEIAKRWYSRTTEFKYSDISQFESPQKVFNGIIKSKVIVDVETSDELFENSGIEIIW